MTLIDKAMEVYQIGQFLDFPVLSQGKGCITMYSVGEMYQIGQFLDFPVLSQGKG